MTTFVTMFDSTMRHLTLLMLTVVGERLQAFAYVANNQFIDRELKPYCWYRSLVIAGARYHDSPGDPSDTMIHSMT